MIIDQLDNLEQYKSLSPRVATAIDFIKSADFKTMELGKHTVIENEIVAIISEYNTKAIADAKPEAHKKYLDIQIVAEGAEQMGYLPLTNQETSIAYNPEKDVEFYNEACSLVTINQGMFAIFLPQDIHQPGVMIDESKKVRKVVVKVLV